MGEKPLNAHFCILLSRLYKILQIGQSSPTTLFMAVVVAMFYVSYSGKPIFGFYFLRGVCSYMLVFADISHTLNEKCRIKGIA